MVLVSLYIPWKLQKIKRKPLFLINRSICWMVYWILINFIWDTISVLSAAFIYYNSSLTHFLSLDSFFTPWKYKKTRGFFLVPFYTTCNQNPDVFRGYRKRLVCNGVKLLKRLIITYEIHLGGKIPIEILQHLDCFK